MTTDLGTTGERVVRAAYRGLWLVIVPAALTVLGLHYLLPPQLARSTGQVGALARIASAAAFPVGAGLFILFVLLLRYWRFYLPGGRHLALLPAKIVANASRACLPELERAMTLHTSIASPKVRRRIAGHLSAAQNTDLDARVLELRDALETADIARLNSAVARARDIVGRSLETRERWRNIAWTAGLGLTALSALLLRQATFESYRVLSASMLPTLAPADEIIVDKMVYRAPRGPRRGELIVFRHVAPSEPEHLIKRVIGLPGDHIGMRGGHPVINGWIVPSCQAGIYAATGSEGTLVAAAFVEFLDGDAYLTLQPLNVTPFAGPYEVLPGEYFVLGDSRGNSSDSRAWNSAQGGGVKLSNIDGLARWFFVGRHHSGAADWSRLFHPLGLDMRLDAMDPTELEQGVARCLDNRPSDTHPPEPGNATAAR